MTIRHETRAAIAALPGKTVQPWRYGDARCHCTGCQLCGELYPTEVFSRHEDECQAALLKALAPKPDPQPWLDAIAIEVHPEWKLHAAPAAYDPAEVLRRVRDLLT